MLVVPTSRILEGVTNINVVFADVSILFVIADVAANHSFISAEGSMFLVDGNLVDDEALVVVSVTVIVDVSVNVSVVAADGAMRVANANLVEDEAMLVVSIT